MRPARFWREWSRRESSGSALLRQARYVGRNKPNVRDLASFRTFDGCAIPPMMA